MTRAEAPLFVPVVVDAVATASAVCKERKASPRCKPKPDAGIIEIQIEGITIRAGRGANAHMIAAIARLRVLHAMAEWWRSPAGLGLAEDVQAGS